MVLRIAREQKSDHYTKKFDTYSHLVTMLFVIYKGCNSLRETVMGLGVCYNKLPHVGLSYIPARSTLSEANSRRDSEVFATIHQELYSRLRQFLPDSRKKKKDKKLYIIDSTTVSLFQEIMKTVGTKPNEGKRKGGFKVHTLMKADEDVPRFIRINSAASHDSPFMKLINLPKGSILTFDKGYVDYTQYNRFTEENVWIVTRIKEDAVWIIEKERTINEHQLKMGVLSDHDVILGHHHTKKAVKVPGRIICYRDPKSGVSFKFFTNNTKLQPLTIANIYQKRWQIELLFKRIKQNYPLRYFLGDNENAIRIQTWCALIADLLLKVIKNGVKRKWSFSGIAAIVRQHLMEYINLVSFLQNPEKALKKWKEKTKKNAPFDLFSQIKGIGGLELQF
jgi:IS4 transposase